MNVDVTGAYIYFIIPIFGGIPVTQTALSVLLVTVLLMVGGVLLGKRVKKRPGTMQVLVEKGIGMLEGIVKDTMGEHNVGWTPYIATIFMSSICGSYIGLTGFLRSSTADLSVPLTWALMTTAIIWYQSIKRNGVLGWLKGFTEPVVVMTPMNLVSEVAQPISMAFRHFGNVVGGSVITSMLYMALSGASSVLLNLIASSGIAVCIVLIAAGAAVVVWGIRRKKRWRKVVGIVLFAVGAAALLQALEILPGIPILGLGLPAVLSLYFDIFSGFIQAFVFCLLSMVYISSACPPPAAEPETD